MNRALRASAGCPCVAFALLTEKSFLIHKGINSKKNHTNIIEILFKYHIENNFGFWLNMGRSLWAKGVHILPGKSLVHKAIAVRAPVTCGVGGQVSSVLN